MGNMKLNALAQLFQYNRKCNATENQRLVILLLLFFFGYTFSYRKTNCKTHYKIIGFKDKKKSA